MPAPQAYLSTDHFSAPLREVYMVPLTDGPVFRLRTWLTGQTDQMGKVILSYEFDQDYIGIFAGADFHCSPQHAPDSDDALRALLGFLTLRPGDTDREYFDAYTGPQMEFARSWACECLQVWADDDIPNAAPFLEWSDLP